MSSARNRTRRAYGVQTVGTLRSSGALMARATRENADGTPQRGRPTVPAAVARPAPGTPLTGGGGLLPQFPPSQVRLVTVVVVVLTSLAIAVGLYLIWELAQILR